LSPGAGERSPHTHDQDAEITGDSHRHRLCRSGVTNRIKLFPHWDLASPAKMGCKDGVRKNSAPFFGFAHPYVPNPVPPVQNNYFFVYLNPRNKAILKKLSDSLATTDLN
jgi:hypothetical protein